MKIRNGFVSNSSSSSFIIVSKNNPEIPAPLEPGKHPKYIRVEVIKEDYNRCRNEIIRTLEDKLRFLTSFYAMNYNEWRNFDENLYITKMTEFRRKIKALGEVYNYHISLTVPPIFFNDDFEFDEEGNLVDKDEVDKEVLVNTEFYEGVSYVKELVEAEDTIRLERFLFNDESFTLVGGDEYYENSVLQYQMKQEMIKHPFNHEFFGTEEEKSFGAWEPYYINSDRIPEYDCYASDEWDDDESWHERYSQPNLPFSYDLEENSLE